VALSSLRIVPRSVRRIRKCEGQLCDDRKNTEAQEIDIGSKEWKKKKKKRRKGRLPAQQPVNVEHLVGGSSKEKERGFHIVRIHEK